MTAMHWMSHQLRMAERFSEPTSQARFNPRPPGVIRPGSATQAVLDFLRQHPGRHWSHSEIVNQTGLSPKSVDWACIFLRSKGLVICFPDSARNPRYHRYGIPKE